MKQVAHLERMSKTLHDIVYPRLAGRDRPFHLLVLDDEADDASVIDLAAQAGPGAMTMQERQVPRRILDLWESRHLPGETASPHLYSTYVAYTATPQANFLQDEDNPLAPRSFVASLRTPGADGDSRVRSSSFAIPDGVKGWYTGGEIYYRTLASVPLCVPTDDEGGADILPDAVRAYLVASAVRLWREPHRVGPAAAGSRTFPSAAAAKSALASPMSMLVHPAAATGTHFEAAGRILAWSAGADESHGPQLLQAADRGLHAKGVVADMEEHPDRWQGWLETYGSGAEICRRDLLLSDTPRVPSAESWPEIRRIIETEVIPGTSVAVINSDVNADDRPEFSPVERGGAWHAPRNMSTIFVSGNVMSRGLTLEGLSTTLFLRSSDAPFADTQMQMQRWFGYRGSYIDLCRVFMPQKQLDLFSHYHANDEALRRDVLAAMSRDPRAFPDIKILQGRSFKATGRVTNVRGIRLWPGPRPFVKFMNPPGEDDHNLELVAGLFAGERIEVPGRFGTAGLLTPTPVKMLEAAEILDELRYLGHGPGPDSFEASRWAAAATHAGLTTADEQFPLYRAPQVRGDDTYGLVSPYSLAAYLRLWHACLERRVPGMVSTDDPPILWDLVDLERRRHQSPKFWVGIRFGEGSEIRSGPLAGLHVPVRGMQRPVTQDHTLEATWGSRNVRDGQIRGDEVFEERANQRAPELTATGDRRPGSDGLILFHVVDRMPSGSPTIALGVSIPLGGPDHVLAVRTGHDE